MSKESMASDLCDQLGPLVEAAGMVNLLNHGAASCVYSEGCNGVTQEHLERFAALVQAAERERWEAFVFDGWRVLKGLDDQAAKRTTHQNVSDTLDALMRVLRA